jgi:hypothetical protein
MHGKSHFTKTGWELHSSAYQNTIEDWEGLDSVKEKVFMITGSKHGVRGPKGKKILVPH